MDHQNSNDSYCISIDVDENAMDWTHTENGTEVPVLSTGGSIISPNENCCSCILEDVSLSGMEEGELSDEEEEREERCKDQDLIFEDTSSEEEEEEQQQQQQQQQNNQNQGSGYDDDDIEVVDEWYEDDQIGGGLDQQSGGSFDASEFYHIGEPVVQRVRRFGTQGEARQFYLRNLENCQNLYEHIDEIFDHALQQILGATSPDALVGATYFHPNLNEPIYVHFRPRKNMTGQVIVEQFERVLQSNKEINLEDPEAVIRIVTVTAPSGSGNHNKQKYFVHHDSLNRGHGGCFITINNKDDNLCLARAVVVAIAMLNKHNPEYQWNTIRTKNPHPRSLQTRKAHELMVRAGLQNHKGPCGIQELNMIQDIIPEYRIKVFSKDAYCAMIFEGKNTDAEKVIHLYHHDDHFTVITSMAAFFMRGYWCADCNVAYNDRTTHRCINKCSSCYHRPPCKEGRISHCNGCNRFFRNECCYQNHLRKYRQGYQGPSTSSTVQTVDQSGTGIGVSICDRIKKCEKCRKQVSQAHIHKHKCGYFKCRTCNEEVLQEGHLCYMKNVDQENEDDDGGNNSDHADDAEDDEYESSAVEIARTSNNRGNDVETIPRFVFFDFETTQERVVRETKLGQELLHVPNLCIAHTICDDCRDRDFEAQCGRCGPSKQIFKGEDCIKNFCRFLFNPKMKNTIAIAHNAKGFDAHFILQYLYGEGIAPKVVTKGLQIISLSVGSIKIIDSFNFLPMALSALPKAFGIEESAKGFFPHLFNKLENWNYVGSWPEAFYYAPSGMKPIAYGNFTQWYKNQIGKVFNFQEELIKYCDSDVDVLLKASMKFRDLFMMETTVDPFAKSLTIAGACNRVFRKLFLKPKTIGLIPQNGYRGRDVQSAKAIVWLTWLSKKNNINIQHANNGREVRIGPYRVDGKCGDVVYEFYGCYWHGCPKCILDRNKIIADGRMNAREAYLHTVERKYYLIREHGLQVVELWECELADMLQKDANMKKLFALCTRFFEPLNPRHAFYGGRTNAVKLYHKVKQNEQIRYVDVCSLYPYTNKYGTYPIGHPKIITDEFEPITKENKPYEGLVKCFVVPPKNLYHPVLPFRHGGKLLFPLCEKCTRDQRTESCNHDECERALCGTWVTCELYKAVDVGYKVTNILEVWHYENVSRYDPQAGNDGLFGQYVNSFMKLKMEAEGWPSQCTDQESRDQYLREVELREGIELDRSKIAKNSGKRALAKLMLNSFWGKFGQRNNQIKTTYFTDPKEYFSLVFDSSTVVHSITIISDHLVSVTHAQVDDLAEILPYTNPVIAAYTTAQARLTLYSYLEKLGERVLYFDTDSVIYLDHPQIHDEYKVPIGWSLGEMTNELQEYGPTAFISEFVSGGPKNYAYVVSRSIDNKKSMVTKVRGITLTKMASRQVNFHSLKNMVHLFVKGRARQEIDVVSHRIGRKREGHKIITHTVSKKFRVVYDKRILLKNFDTVPYGWQFTAENV